MERNMIDDFLLVVATGVLRHFRGRQDRRSKKWVLNEFLNSDGRKSKNQQEKISDDILKMRNFNT